MKVYVLLKVLDGAVEEKVHIEGTLTNMKRYVKSIHKSLWPEMIVCTADIPTDKNTLVAILNDEFDIFPHVDRAECLGITTRGALVVES